MLATRNGLPYLEEQLSSIIRQTRPADEIVVVDDGSEDGSIETVRRVLAGDGAERTISTNPDRLGPAANFGEGIRRATGDIIVLCDQDDRWRPDRLARLESVLLSTGALAAFSDGRLIDSEGSAQGKTLWEAAGFTGRLRRRWRTGDHFGTLLQANIVTGATLAFRATLRDVILPIPSTAWHDHWIALLAAATGTIVAVPDLLIDYRLHLLNTMGLPPASLRELTATRLGETAPHNGAIHRLQEVRDRLQGCSGLDHSLQQVGKKLDHLERRAQLPVARRSRILPVALEALSGRYHRLGSGWHSIAADLLRSHSNGHECGHPQPSRAFDTP